MKQIIAEKLKEIETRQNVRVLFCVESGSRAWGFASPDSDYDVRFVYVRPIEEYLRLEKTRDVIEWQLDETLDINGWDLQKTLRLLHKSNPTVFEWNASPIVYRTSGEWSRIAGIIDGYFVKKAGLYHYLSSARSNYRAYLQGETVKLKKYFYVLRPLLACRWILKNGTPPPMLFDELKEACLEDELRPAVEELLRQKRLTPELGEGPRIGIINDYLDAEIARIGALLDGMPDEPSGDWETLNRAFLDVLRFEQKTAHVSDVCSSLK